LQAKNRGGAVIHPGAAPERIAGIYRRDFSTKRKLPALFRTVTKLEGTRELNQMVIEKKK